tara:strand:+ start:3314 stop:4738 length:1425 start_codon:yes stop_codon:yes gene_type:complete
MAKQNRTTLKSYFQTGDIPSENNYVDLIDSFAHLTEGNVGDLVVSGSLLLSGSEAHLQINGGDGLIVSGNISASGTLMAEKLEFGPGTPDVNTNLLSEGQLILKNANASSSMNLHQGTNGHGYWKNDKNAYILVDKDNDSTGDLFQVAEGSFAGLNSVYLSVGEGTNNQGALSSLSHITASDNIVITGSGMPDTRGIQILSSSTGVTDSKIFLDLVSGTNITSPRLFLTSSYGHFKVQNQSITMSGDISASGTIIGSNITSTNTLSVGSTLSVDGTDQGADLDVKAGLSGSVTFNEGHAYLRSDKGLAVLLGNRTSGDPLVDTSKSPFQLWKATLPGSLPGSNSTKVFEIDYNGNITKLNQVTASGDFIFGATTNTLITSRIQTHDLSSGGASDIGIQLLGNITASNNISASGDITATGTLIAGTNISASGNIISTGNLQIDGSQVDFTNLPTSDPSVAGRLWNSGSYIKISAG